MKRDSNPGPDEQAEERLARAFGSLFDGAEPPASMRESLARAARERARPQVRPAGRPRWRLLAGAAALAAGLLIVAGSALLRDPRNPAVRDASADGAFDVADLDRSGRVDVWDAYLVARAVEGDGPLDARLDLDGDGAITRADADLVAQRAVEVPR